MARSAQSSRIVADVGGTNTRIAVFDENGAQFRALSTYVNRDFSSLEDIIAQWRGSLAEPAPDVCCIAVAAPPADDLVVMSNIDWSFSCRDLANRFGFRALRWLNDFEANAYALPHLASGDRKSLYPGNGERASRLATVGPGTGLGGAFLEWFDDKPCSFACEPGHMGLSPGNELELEIFKLLLPRHGDIHAELLVSGPGLARLYQALGEVRGERSRSLQPADISRLALVGEDSLCVAALQTFCALLGSVCGDFLLATGSYGGLYLAGGIVPRLDNFLAGSSFHKRLVEKGVMCKRLEEVPIYTITTSQPGLLGAAHAPLQ